MLKFSNKKFKPERFTLKFGLFLVKPNDLVLVETITFGS